MNRSHLQAAVFFMFLLMPAVQTQEISPAVRAAIREMKKLADNISSYMQQKESTCAPEKAEGPLRFGCIKEPKNHTCEMILTFEGYFSEAIGLNVEINVTYSLREVKQRIQDMHRKTCKAAPAENVCKVDFTKPADRDYEKFCNVLSLVDVFKQWLNKLSVTRKRKRQI